MVRILKLQHCLNHSNLVTMLLSPLSSFDAYERLDVYSKLKQINKVFIRTQVNPIRRATIGYQRMYKSVNHNIYQKLKSNFGAVIELNDDGDDDNGITLGNGWINNEHNNIGLTSKVLNARYEIIHQIGYGSFSQVYEAKDLYAITPNNSQGCNNVAVKILRRGFHLIGLREYLLLQQLSFGNNSSSLGSTCGNNTGNIQYKFFLDVFDIFQYDEHCCLVLSLMSATMFDFLCQPRPPSPLTTADRAKLSQHRDNGNFSSSKSHSSSGNAVPIIQPRAIRGYTALMKFSQGMSSSRNAAAVASMSPQGVHQQLQQQQLQNQQQLQQQLLLQKQQQAQQQLRTEMSQSQTQAHVLRSSSDNIATIRKVALHLVSCLCALRREGLIHGDIKPENVFVRWRMRMNSSSSSSNTNGSGGDRGGSTSLATASSAATAPSTHEGGLAECKQLSSSGSSDWLPPKYELGSIFHHFSTVTEDVHEMSSPAADTGKRVRLSPNDDTAAATSYGIPNHHHHNQQQQHQYEGGYDGKHNRDHDNQPCAAQQLSGRCPEIVLGDLGSAIHEAEAADYLDDFEIQSLPYRAPEVVIGVPFTAQIDMWSTGVLLVELLLRRPLFLSRDRSELFSAICSNIGEFSAERFSGGKYASMLYWNMRDSQRPPSPSDAYADSSSSMCSSLHLLKIKKLLFPDRDDDGSNSSNDDGGGGGKSLWESVCNNEDVVMLVHFLSGLLQIDPDQRLTPVEALNHPFLSSLHNLPSSLLSSLSLSLSLPQLSSCSSTHPPSPTLAPAPTASMGDSTKPAASGRATQTLRLLRGALRQLPSESQPHTNVTSFQ